MSQPKLLSTTWLRRAELCLTGCHGRSLRAKARGRTQARTGRRALRNHEARTPPLHVRIIRIHPCWSWTPLPPCVEIWPNALGSRMLSPDPIQCPPGTSASATGFAEHAAPGAQAYVPSPRRSLEEERAAAVRSGASSGCEPGSADACSNVPSPRRSLEGGARRIISRRARRAEDIGSRFSSSTESGGKRSRACRSHTGEALACSARTRRRHRPDERSS